MNLLNHVWYKYIRGLHDRLHVQGDRINDVWDRVLSLEKRVEELEAKTSRLEEYALKQGPRISACEEDISCMKEMMRIAGWIDE